MADSKAPSCLWAWHASVATRPWRASAPVGRQRVVVQGLAWPCATRGSVRRDFVCARAFPSAPLDVPQQTQLGAIAQYIHSGGSIARDGQDRLAGRSAGRCARGFSATQASQGRAAAGTECEESAEAGFRLGSEGAGFKTGQLSG
eukprot:337198-Prymnesium_polylepis.2